MKSRTILAAAVIAIPMALLSGCDKTDPTAPDQSTIEVTANPTTLRLGVGQSGTSTITALVLDHDGQPVSGVRVRFSTDAGSMRSGADGVTTNGNGEAKDTLTLHFDDGDAEVTARASGAGSKSVTVTAGTNAAPIAVPDVSPTSAHTSDTIHFDGTGSHDSDGSVASYRWTLSYPGSANPNEILTTATFDKSYTDARTVHVTLQVTDNEGKQSSVVPFVPDITVAVNFAPTAVISGGPFSTPVNVQLSLNATASHDSTLDTTGSVKAWDWTWGDGNTERTLTGNANHTWNSTGAKTVSLTVWDNGTDGSCTPTNTFGTAPCTNSKASTPVTVTVTVN